MTSGSAYLLGGAVILAIIVAGIAIMVITVRVSGSERRPSRRQAEIQRAAAADVAAVQEEDRSFRPDGPGDQLDDL